MGLLVLALLLSACGGGEIQDDQAAGVEPAGERAEIDLIEGIEPTQDSLDESFDLTPETDAERDSLFGSDSGADEPSSDLFGGDS